MASPASSSPSAAFAPLCARFSLLLLVSVSIGCQVKDSGLAGPSDDGGVPGSGGATTDYVDAAETGGQAGATGAGGAQGALDLGLAIDWPGAAGAGGNPGLEGGTGGTGGPVELDGAAVGGSTSSQGGVMGGNGGGTGGVSGSGGVTDWLDADSPTIDAEPVDQVIEEDSTPGDFDTGLDDAAPADAGEEVAEDGPGTADDVADATEPPVLDTADEANPPPPDSADALPVDTRPPRTPVWSDEFDGAANTAVDATKWSYVTWAPGQVNNEKQRYTSSRQNVFLDGYGHLVLRGLKSGQQYTSGRIDTSGSNGGAGFSFKTGRIEVRAKLPSGQGSFPGIVMLGTSGGWPQSGELALMEQYGQPDQKSWYYASAYADSSPGSGDKRSIRYDFPDSTTASTDFHVYSADWYTDHVVFQMDGNEVGRTDFGATSPFHTTSEYIVLDLALGGDMGGTIDQGAFHDDVMDLVVDYVRVYSF